MYKIAEQNGRWVLITSDNVNVYGADEVIAEFYNGDRARNIASWLNSNIKQHAEEQDMRRKMKYCPACGFEVRAVGLENERHCINNDCQKKYDFKRYCWIRITGDDIPEDAIGVALEDSWLEIKEITDTDI